MQGEDMRNSKSVSRVEMRLDKQAGTRLLVVFAEKHMMPRRASLRRLIGRYHRSLLQITCQSPSQFLP